MAEILFEGNGVISLGSVESEEDLKHRPGMNINPPPKDGRCMCCNRHINELKPFGKAGDPLVGDFDGAFLVKGWRREGPYDEEAERAVKEAEKCYCDEGFETTLDWMIAKYGKKKGEELFFTVEIHDTSTCSWECRDCFVLYEEEYFAKLREQGIKTDLEHFIAIPVDQLRPMEELPGFLSQRKKNH